ncbi:BA75_04820T0 [Komagataella pastoris]|uniref:BA75_04820T0 n=1 Tax=Komagataella pastoris TaxID=4922 RepID=A0A1B2JIN4_PICPA|nr:BA75_04820T0 [Komagataella pastoris]
MGMGSEIARSLNVWLMFVAQPHPFWQTTLFEGFNEHPGDFSGSRSHQKSPTTASPKFFFFFRSFDFDMVVRTLLVRDNYDRIRSDFFFPLFFVVWLIPW